MTQISVKIITLYITLKRMMFLSYVDGSLNVWLEPQIFEFGKPASLHCNVTEKTKAVAWWIVEEDRSPVKISKERVLNFASANHSHSAIYECFHTFENNNGFLKYSRKVLVLETHCSKCVRQSENLSQALVNWKFRFSTFPFDDVHFECNETRKSCYDRIGNTLKEVNFESPALTTCSIGFENSKIYLNKCQRNETLDDHVCNRSCFLNLESTKENRQDVNVLLQLTPPGNVEERTSSVMISIPLPNDISLLLIFLVATATIILTTIIIIMMVSLKKYLRKEQSKEIYDFREDEEDDDETRDALTDECQTTTKTPKMASTKKILCFIKTCPGNIENWC